MIAALIISYFIGSIPTSYIVGKLARGIDLRAHGSKNLGATNVYRILGWKYAIPVAIIDIAKGAVPVLYLAPTEVMWLPFAGGVAAVLGHMFSPFVRFKGGKGVATAAGVFLALSPLSVLIALVVWAACLWLTGYVSLSSILAVLTVPVTVRLLHGARYTFWAAIALVLLIVFAHRRNIARLIAGTENRFRTRGSRPSGRPAVRPSDP
jgi:acyl phosphate:glycerol-3-phosphate acyltransferase